MRELKNKHAKLLSSSDRVRIDKVILGEMGGDESNCVLDGIPTEIEIENAVKSLKCGRCAGPYGMKEDILREWISMNSELNRERDLESRGTRNFNGVEI